MSNPALKQSQQSIPQPKVKVLVFANNKGGIGKTTCATLAAEYAAMILNKRVLIVEMDGQMNMTSQWLPVDSVDGEREPIPHPDLTAEDLSEYNLRSSITDIWVHGKLVEPYPTPIGPEDRSDFDSPRVDVVSCSGSGMAEVLRTIGDDPNALPKYGPVGARAIPSKRVVDGLFSFIHNDVVAEYYDLVVIDTAPQKAAAFMASINSATHVVFPYTPEPFAVMGFGPGITEIRRINASFGGQRKEIDFIGFLPSKVDSRSASHKEMIDKLCNARHSDVHFPPGLIVPKSEAIVRRSTYDRFDTQAAPSIFNLRPSDAVRKACQNTFSYILDRVFAGSLEN